MCSIRKMASQMGSWMVCLWVQLLVVGLVTVLGIISNFELIEDLGTGLGCTAETMKEVEEWDA